MEAQGAGAPKEYLAQLAAIGGTKPTRVDEEDVIEPEIVYDDPMQVWQQVLAAAGRRGWSMDQTEDEFASFSGGTMAGAADADELNKFLDHLKATA
jgi:prolyl-tRNA editing enzyme YbaK/EbsC (Cys-tRNA(Pro) deacylase)